MNELLKSKGSKPRTGKVKKCKVCNEEFYVRPSAISSKYCSYKCTNESKKNRAKKVCDNCHKLVEKPKSSFKWNKIRGHKNFYCSKECSHTALARKKKGTIVSKIWTMRRADSMFSDYIRNRDKWKCRYCNKNFWEKSGQLHNSHFWGRSNMATRFDPQNCIALCYSCHIWKLESEKQGIYRTMMLKYLGEKDYKLLEKKSNTEMSKRDSILEFMEWIKPHLKDKVIPKKRPAMVENEHGMVYWD